MIISLFLVPALAAGAEAYVLARRVEQHIQERATYQGGYALSNPVSCPANYSTACGSKTNVNQLCCPQGNTCFGSSQGYCCPNSQDCNTYVTTFPACADPAANMYASSVGFFCCAQGLTGVIPTSGYPFCETADVSVAVSLLATMISQYGGTSVTPFGGFATTPAVATGTAVSPNAGATTTPTGTSPPPTTATSPTKSPSTSAANANSTFGPLSNAAFVGIVIGGIVVLSIALSIWRWCKRTVRTSLENLADRSSKYDPSHPPGPSMIPAYIPLNAPMYEPTAPPMHAYDHGIYDPVLERRRTPITTTTTTTTPYNNAAAQTSLLLSPRRSPSPNPSLGLSPRTPSPAYSALDERLLERQQQQHEMPDVRSGAYDFVEQQQHELPDARTGMYDPVEVHGEGSARGRVEIG